jgi:hypothetical protein
MVILGTMAHTLITSVQRRRRDLAVLKTLGFVRGQVAATIAWQATTFAVVALCLGLPFGGRRRHGPGRQSGRRRPGQDGQSHATGRGPALGIAARGGYSAGSRSIQMRSRTSGWKSSLFR